MLGEQPSEQQQRKHQKYKTELYQKKKTSPTQLELLGFNSS
ncbi:hypothetical protein LINPERHAP2_LOCUS37975 [Linum perenne]